MSGRFDALLLLNHVLHWLSTQGVQPELRASQIPAAEQAAADLLLALDVEPLTLGGGEL